jgi:HEAT repeat protein
MRSFLSTSLLTLVVGAALPVWADDLAALRMLLGSPDQVPAAAHVRSLDAEGRVLRGIAADRRETRYVRMRAASLLGLYDRPEVRAGLDALVAAADDDLEVRVQALGALTFLEGPHAVARLTRTLASPERVLREVAVIGLDRIGTASARAALEKHRTVERDQGIRARLDRLRR